jgi:DNA-directed RNA polymerase specialized sigma24 family protein
MTSAENTAPTTETLLLAIATLLADAHQSKNDKVSNENSAAILLASAGISHRDIAKITGRQTDAVRMAITRSRKSTSGDTINVG